MQLNSGKVTLIFKSHRTLIRKSNELPSCEMCP